MKNDKEPPDKKEENTTEIAPALFKEFLNNQAKELEIKSREIDLDKQKDDHKFEFAKSALGAQISDRKEQRSFHVKTKRNTHIFVVSIACLFVVLIITALAMDKDQIALEIIKVVIYMLTGGAGGYAVGRLRKINTKDSSDSQD